MSYLYHKKIFLSKIGISIDDTRDTLFFLQSLLHRSRHKEVSFNVFEDLINESNFFSSAIPNLANLLGGESDSTDDEKDVRKKKNDEVVSEVKNKTHITGKLINNTALHSFQFNGTMENRVCKIGIYRRARCNAMDNEMA